MRRKKSKGQVLVFISFALLVLFAMLGLVIDGGWAYFRQQSAQAAADAAALAGAQAALYGSGGNPVCGANGVVCQSATACSNPVASPPVTDADSSCLYAKANGFAVAAGSKQNVLIEANITSPPPTAPGVSDTYYVTARVSEAFPLTFSAVLGRLTQLIAARATAVISQRTQTCLYVLDPSGTSFTVTGSGTINAQNCGLFINSNNAQAMTVTGSGTIRADEIDIVGGLNVTGSGSLIANPLDVGGTFSKTGSGSVSTVTSTPGAAQIGNPLSYLKPPTVGNCDHASTVSIVGSSSVTLSPGVYCGGISITGSGTVTFNPGTYILNGGGLSQTGSGTLSGTGVTFYDTSSAGHAYGPLNITGSGTLNFSAPTSGSLQGILFFQDPTEPVGSAGSSITGSSSSNMNGVFYFPTTSLTYTGSGTSTGYTSLVVYDLTLTGSGALNDNYAALGNGSPFKAISLVE